MDEQIDLGKVTVEVDGEKIEGWAVVTGKVVPMVGVPEAEYNSLIAALQQIAAKAEYESTPVDGGWTTETEKNLAKELWDIHQIARAALPKEEENNEKV